jgi:hypothetical protein
MRAKRFVRRFFKNMFFKNNFLHLQFGGGLHIDDKESYLIGMAFIRACGG